MKVDVEGFRMEIILSQSASPQWDPLPRRAAVDTESDELGTPPRSPAIGTRSGPGVSRAKTQREEEGLFPFETRIDGFFNPNLTSSTVGRGGDETYLSPLWEGMSR